MNSQTGTQTIAIEITRYLKKKRQSDNEISSLNRI